MGFKLMRNFNRPYFSGSISEFWSRWHISLSTWFKDYLYISLGGNRVSIPRWYFNLFFVFLVSGLWHGANWTFIIWGALNGLYLVAALVRDRIMKKMGVTFSENQSWYTKIAGILFTFLLICFSWIFFRSKNLDQAILVIRKIFTFEKGPFFVTNPTFTYALFAIAFLLVSEAKEEYYKGSFTLLDNKSLPVRYATYIALVLLILLIGVFDGSQFIYFQF
jgi:alginate O-acetyltransferase complex protein AlgI